jgi:crotonobetainyl-CoA:carnitine CoA-transferase CaiB-like acyl-CoA transferase
MSQPRRLVVCPQYRELLWCLVERADVSHQNFVRGVAERLGLGEAALRRPDIVYSSVNTHAEYQHDQLLARSATGARDPVRHRIVASKVPR